MGRFDYNKMKNFFLPEDRKKTNHRRQEDIWNMHNQQRISIQNIYRTPTNPQEKEKQGTKSLEQAFLREGNRHTNENVKIRLALLVHGEMQLTSQYFTVCPPDWQKVRHLTTSRAQAGKDLLEYLGTADERENWYNHCGNHFGIFLYVDHSHTL